MSTSQGIERRCCNLVALQHHGDDRGYLDVAQLGQGLPWAARRFYVIGGVPEGMLRGHHGHHVLEQFLVVVRGRVKVNLHGSGKSRTLELTSSTQGLHITPGIYSTQQFFDDALLLVLASGEYDPMGYLYDPLEAKGDVGDE